MSNGGGKPRTAVHQKVNPAVTDHAVPEEADFGAPNAARIFDYYLGGKDNYAADREAARRVLGATPDVPLAALENREFLKRVIPFLIAEQGISQFVDIGSGLPTRANVHQLVNRHAPDTRVAYVDNDAVAVEHSRSLLHGLPAVIAVWGDLRGPECVLSHPDLGALIDFARPVALLMTLVLDLIPSGDSPYEMVATFRDALSPGSFLVLSHASDDGREPGALSNASGPQDIASAHPILRSHAEIARFFDGLELVDPGVVFLPQWRPTGGCPLRGGTRWGYCGVGKKP
jgi:SAM-dependent methyltransferase